MDNEFGPVDLTGLKPDKLQCEDRLEEAKQYFNLTLNSVITEYGRGLGIWLISKIEQCRDENAKVAEKLKEEIERLRSISCAP